MSIVTGLSERVHGTRYEELPQEAIKWAKLALMDYIGVTLAGSLETGPRLVERTFAGAKQTGPSLVFGRSYRTSAADAAVINGTSSHVLDFDDASNTIGGHPSVTIFPAIIALGEEINATGRDIIASFVAGVEVEARIGRAVNLHHYEKGWHPTATIGTFGCAAACARLMGLNARQIAYAIGIAASFASGIKANFGTMVKSLHVGHCARNGLFAASLAREGFDSSLNAFEHKQGFFNVFNGEGNYRPEQVLAGWGEPYDILTPGLAMKQYPCCASTHPAIDATIALVCRHGLNPGNVAQIKSWTHKRRLNHTNRPDPLTSLDAKFSVQYCVSRALMHGAVKLEHFQGDAHKDAVLRSVLPKVKADIYTDTQFPPDNHYGAEVEITTTDGKVYREKVDQPHGRTTKNPLSPEMMKAKFEDCASRVMAPHSVSAVYDLVQDLERISDIRAITDAMIAEAPQRIAVAG